MRTDPTKSCRDDMVLRARMDAVVAAQKRSRAAFSLSIVVSLSIIVTGNAKFPDIEAICGVGLANPGVNSHVHHRLNESL